MFEIAPHTRLRPSPYFEATVAEGVTGFIPYNQMLLPMGFGDPEAEYWRLLNGVSQWDVAGERQVEITGPDAARFTQLLTPRNLSTCAVGQCKYVLITAADGGVITLAAGRMSANRAAGTTSTSGIPTSRLTSRFGCRPACGSSVAPYPATSKPRDWTPTSWRAQ